MRKNKKSSDDDAAEKPEHITSHCPPWSLLHADEAGTTRRLGQGQTRQHHTQMTNILVIVSI